jgi:hypothetical protein
MNLLNVKKIKWDLLLLAFVATGAFRDLAILQELSPRDLLSMILVNVFLVTEDRVESIKKHSLFGLCRDRILLRITRVVDRK